MHETVAFSTSSIQGKKMGDSCAMEDYLDDCRDDSNDGKENDFATGLAGPCKESSQRPCSQLDD